MSALAEQITSGHCVEPVLLSMEVQRSAGQVLILLRGELCEITAPDLDCLINEGISSETSAASSAGPPIVTLDLSGLTFLGAAGLSVFVACDRTLRRFGGKLRLVGARPIATRMLAITGLEGLQVEPLVSVHPLSKVHQT